MQEKKRIKKDKGVEKKRRTIRLVLRIFGIGISVIGIILLALYVYIRISFPPERLQQLAIEQVKKHTGRELNIGLVALNIFRGFEFENVVMSSLPDSLKPDTSLVQLPIGQVSIDRIVLKYYLRHLLNRHLIIREILLESPRVELEIVPVDTTAQKIPEKTPAKPPILPIQVELKQFKISDASIVFNLRDSLQLVQAHLNHLNIELNHSLLPRGDLLQPGAKIKLANLIRCDNSQVRLYTVTVPDSNGLKLEFNLDLSANLAVNSLDSITLTLETKLSDFFFFARMPDSSFSINVSEIFSILGKAQIDYSAQAVDINSLSINVGREHWFELSGAATNILSTPALTMEFIKGDIPVNQVINLVKNALPFLSDQLPEIKSSRSFISLTGVRFGGSVGSLPGDLEAYVNGKITASPLAAAILGDTVSINLTSMECNLAGQYSTSAKSSAAANLNLVLESGEYVLNDSTKIDLGAGSVAMHLILKENFMPGHIRFEIKQEVFEAADLQGNFTFSIPDRMANLSGDGEFKLEKFPLAGLTQKHADGYLDANFQFEVRSLNDIRTELLIKARDFKVALAKPETKLASVPLPDLSVSMTANIDTLFENISVRSITAEFGKVARLDALGSFNTVNSHFEFKLTDLTLTHNEIFRLLPESITNSLQTIKVNGTTSVSASASGQILPDSVIYLANANLKLNDTNVDSVDRFNHFHGIAGDLNLTATAGDLTADFVLWADSVMLPNLTPGAITRNEISLRAKSTGFNSAIIESGHLQIPTFNIKGKFDALATELNQEKQVITGNVILEQNAIQPITISKDVSVKGNIVVTASATFDTRVLNGTIVVDPAGLSVYLPGATAISNIDGKLDYSFVFDLEAQTFMVNNLSSTQLPDYDINNVNYFAFDPYFSKTGNHLSKLSIASISTSGYQLQNLNFSMLLDNARIEIPNFIIDFYGGNIGGSCFFEAPANINKAKSESRYQVGAHISSINSALLLRARDLVTRAAIINGNLFFEGKGFEPGQDLDVKGYIYITEIGASVANNLLQLLDPEEKDSGIKMTRRLLSHGLKPKLFSFELKHGFFYPTILFSIPFYFPVKLNEEKFELSRKPVAFFMNNLMKLTPKGNFIKATKE